MSKIKKKNNDKIIIQVEKDKKNAVSNSCTEVFCAREDINPSPEMYLKVRRKCNLVHQKLQTWTKKQNRVCWFSNSSIPDYRSALIGCLK